MQFQKSILILLFLCACSQGIENGGKLVNNKEYYNKPLIFPVTVSVKDNHIRNDVLYAIDWWNDQLKFHWAHYCQHHLWARCDQFPKFILYKDKHAIVSVMEVKEDDQPYNALATNWTSITGIIWCADIELVENRWNILVIAHELGHSVFGLAHDSYSTDLDYDSVMVPSFTKKHYKYIVTHDDAEIIFRDLFLLRSLWR